jgi:hypothetical protein
MRCSQCERFDPEKRACRDGKINPPNYVLTVEAVNVFGVRALCMFNDHRERLAPVRALTGIPPLKDKEV